MLFDEEELDKYTKKHTVFDESLIPILPIEVVEQAAKFQVEFYFGQSNYFKDEHLRNAEDKEGWIPLELIYKFNKIKKFRKRLSMKELAHVMRLSTVVEIGHIDRFRDGNNLEYFIKKKQLKLKSEYRDFFGYDVETIKQLTLEQFEIFLQHKKTFED